MNEIRTDWIILLVTAVTGYCAKSRQQFSYLKTIPPFLLLTLFVELLGRYYRLRSINNILLFNIYSVLELTYFIYTLYLILKRSFIRKLICIVPVYCLVNILFVQGLKTFHTYSYSLSVLLIVYLCVYYYYITFKEAVIENLLQESSFWLVTGFLFFYATSLSVMGVVNYLAELPKEVIHLSRNILLSVNGIFYLILLIAFICPINIQKSIRNF